MINKEKFKSIMIENVLDNFLKELRVVGQFGLKMKREEKTVEPHRPRAHTIPFSKATPQNYHS